MAQAERGEEKEEGEADIHPTVDWSGDESVYILYR